LPHRPRELDRLRSDYESGDLTALYVTLAIIATQAELRWTVGRKRVRAPVPKWIVDALTNCIDQCLAKQKANRSRNRLDYLRTQAEQYERYLAVAARVKPGVNMEAVYQAVADERARATSNHVTSGAIRQSYRKMKAATTHPPYSLGFSYRLGALSR